MFRHLFRPDTPATLFLTDAGTETCLIYDQGVELPKFSAITLLKSPEGRAALQKYFQPFPAVAAAAGLPIVLETATWRASPAWASDIGLTAAELDAANVEAVRLLLELRSEHAGKDATAPPVVVSGCLGPRGDGYVPGDRMTVDQAREYHRHQVEVFSKTEVDVVSAFTLSYVEEAVGIALAVKDFGLPLVLSFTVETDGRLPSGQTLQEAVELVDTVSGSYPAWFLVNCAHPDHFRPVFDAATGAWIRRVRGFRANASRKSHAELDGCSELDAGDPAELARLVKADEGRFPLDVSVRRVLWHKRSAHPGHCCRSHIHAVVASAFSASTLTRIWE